MLTVGILFAWWNTRRADRDLRGELLQQTRLVAQTLEIDRIRSLRGTAADVDTPDYRRLKEQLAAVRSANAQCRFAYLTGRRSDGTIFFFVDSEPVNSTDYSPPGQPYSEASDDFRRVFSSGEEFVEGPFADRWGVWVSALVPVTDRVAGDVVAVLGMDIDARVWKWDLAARSALPVGLMLVLLTGAAVVWANRRPVVASPRPLARRLLPPLAVLLLLLMAGEGWVLYQQHQRQLAAAVASDISQFTAELHADLQQQSVGLTAAVVPIAADPRVGAALRAGDRASLLAAWNPVFETLSRQNHIAHLYFMDARGASLARIHQTDYQPDTHASVVALEAQRTGKSAAGPDLGPLGTFTLRAVQPVLHDGELVGYVELGRFLGDVLPSARARSDVQMNVLIRKEFLDRPQWEDAMRRLGRQPDWDRLSASVVTFASQGRLPDALVPLIDASSENHAHGETNREVAGGGAQWRVFTIPLQDAAGREVGDLWVARDISAETAAFARRTILGAVAGAVLLSLMLGIIDVFLRRTDKGLRAQQEQLRAERENLKAVFASSPVGMLLLDGQTMIVDANGVVAAMISRPLDRIILQVGGGGLGCAHSLEHEKGCGFSASCPQCPFRSALMRVLQDGASVRGAEIQPALLVAGQETHPWLSVSAEPVLLNGRRHVIVALEDISARKRTEAELCERTDMLQAINSELEAQQIMMAAQTREIRALFDGMPGHSFLKDRNGRYLAANQVFCKDVDKPEDAIVGATDDDLFPSDQARKRAADDQRVFSAEVPLLDTEDLIVRGRSRRWMLTRKIPVRAPDGTVDRLVGISIDITARKAMEEKLRSAALTDKLTGLPNRTLVCDRLQQAIARAQRLPDYHFAVLFIDFDRFKIVNDSLGHQAGDLLLQEMARRLHQAVRDGDSVCRRDADHTTARLGGDEFVILLDGIARPEDARLVAQRILETLAPPYRLGEHLVYSTASIGLVTSDISADSAEEILRDADTAMYEAKLAGKARFAVFDVSMRRRLQNRLLVENDLRKALHTPQVFLMYQPIVSLNTGEMESVEALVRWNHPQRGLIPPAEFIPIAEEIGLILPLGEWVLREACRQFVSWRKESPQSAPRSISVNLSRKQLLLPDLPAIIRDILAQTGMDPHCLRLEVTESTVMTNTDVMIGILRAIKDIGVKIDIDDFGTGYSSLACLHQFPIDALKIDRSFIANMNRGRDFTALVQAVAQLAGNLHIAVVAEGIDHPDQTVILQSLDCAFGQGYLFSKPLPAQDVPQFRVPPHVLVGEPASASAAAGGAAP
jgi:diguanylate cyclase (GGDEF)-like protein/PAS domain S-box-containing protein